MLPKHIVFWCWKLEIADTYLEVLMPYPFTSPPAISTAAFVILLATVQAVLIWTAGRAGEKRGAKHSWMKRAAAFSMSIAAITAALAGFVLRPDFPPATVAFFALTNLGAVFLALSPVGKALGPALPIGGWVLLQSFRLPLELIMHSWAEVGTLPPQMTWTGQNIDIVAGLVSLVAGVILLKKPSRALAYGAHAVGLVLLFNVIRVAATSTPGPLKVFEAPLLLAFNVPFVWIVPFAVGVALFSHITALRALSADTQPATEE